MTELLYQVVKDGLRAVAITPVVFYYADLRFSDGYIGFDGSLLFRDT